MNKILILIKRWLILFLTIIIIFNNKLIVKADTSTLTKNIIEGIYAVTKLTNGEEHYYYLDIYKMGNNTVYCIEPGVDITENNYYFTDDYSSLPYSESTIEYIKQIAFFGYDYFGHQTKEYYMATQELIWETLGNDVYWSETFDHTKEININVQKSDIQSLIIKNGKLSLNTINLTVHNYDEYLTYTNNELTRFEIVSSTLEEVSLYNNTVTIKNNHNLDGQTITFRFKNYTNTNPLLYYNGTSQKMFSGGYIPFKEYTVKINVDYGNLKINKYDKETLSNEVSGNGSLEGAIYELYNYDNSKIDEYTTDENGEIFIDNLEYGNYYLKEINPSNGYKLDDNTYTIEINNDNNELTVYEEPIYGKLEIIKTYDINNTYEEGVIFDIYDEEENLYDSIITDDEGYVSIELPYGKYIIKQINSIEGYQKVEDFIVDIDGSLETYTYELNDKVIPKIEENIIINPKTGDNIYIHFTILILSIIITIAYKILNIKKEIAI